MLAQRDMKGKKDTLPIKVRTPTKCYWGDFLGWLDVNVY